MRMTLGGVGTAGKVNRGAVTIQLGTGGSMKKTLRLIVFTLVGLMMLVSCVFSVVWSLPRLPDSISNLIALLSTDSGWSGILGKTIGIWLVVVLVLFLWAGGQFILKRYERLGSKWASSDDERHDTNSGVESDQSIASPRLERETMDTTPSVKVPTAFVSYSWDSDQHRDWVRQLATRLRGDGVDVKLDQWSVVPGDNLPEFMERAVRENDFVLIVCTPRYKAKSDERKGGVGYEGDIMTAEVFTTRDQRKFIPILREGEWTEAAPSWLLGKIYVDLRGGKYSEANYRKLLDTLHGRLPQPPPLGTPPVQPVVTPPPSAGKIPVVPKWSGGPIRQWDRPLAGFETIPLRGKTQLVENYPDPDVPVPKPLLGQDNIPFWLETGADRAAILGIDLGPDYYNRKPSVDVVAGAQGADRAYVLLTAGNGWRYKHGVKFEGRRIGCLKFYFDTDKCEEIGLFLGQNIRDWAYNTEGVAGKLADPNVEQVWHSDSDRHTLDMLWVGFGGPRNVTKFCVVAECEDLPSDYLDDPPHIRVSGLTYRVTGQRSADETENLQAASDIWPSAVAPKQQTRQPSLSRATHTLPPPQDGDQLTMNKLDTIRTDLLRFRLYGVTEQQKQITLSDLDRFDAERVDERDSRYFRDTMFMRDNLKKLVSVKKEELRRRLDNRVSKRLDTMPTDYIDALEAALLDLELDGITNEQKAIVQSELDHYRVRVIAQGEVDACIAIDQMKSKLNVLVPVQVTAQIDRTKLLDLMVHHFNVEELKDFCFKSKSKLDVDYDNLGSETISGKCRELIGHCERHKRVAELLKQLKELRPEVNWSECES